MVGPIQSTMRKFRKGLRVGALCCALVAGAAGIATAAEAPARPASIPFANHGGIYNWKANGVHGLWIQDSRRQWYYASTMGPCMGLPYAQSLGFDTRPMGSFDRFSSIVVPREGRCALTTFTASEGPPAKDSLAG